MSTFTQLIRQEANAIWEANLDHPFVQGIAKGSLPIENFRYYVLQDSYYLSHFARIQAIAASRAEELSITAKMAAHAQGTFQAELSLHEKFIGQLGVTREELQSFLPAPTAYAYTSHLYRVAASGSLGEIIAAMLPCYWIYYEIGETLKHAAPETPIYQEWIAAYGSDWFSELVNEQLSLLDTIAENASEKEREKMKQHFIYSCHYELKFWEMAHTLEGWSITNKKAAVH
ncbi:MULTISPECIES: thiaminase II [Mesobacillus]|uniref:Aminopyrimidine aminohydrolase n=2 Tax=Mesobacillus TaxID=2675231 RepID=A0A0D6ZE34_9BACI|nr:MULTISPECIES: thiaminase II [Mesobacillus]KIY23782.1 thiaminase [Mesobacillus subterraneus]MDQ0413396.1 thiaminase/transcriptional activator TenA [Mesobacillus stamsii]